MLLEQMPEEDIEVRGTLLYGTRALLVVCFVLSSTIYNIMPYHRAMPGRDGCHVVVLRLGYRRSRA